MDIQINPDYKQDLFTRFEDGRVRRAIQMVQNDQAIPKIKQYKTTRDNCFCYDFVYRNQKCKHMIAVRILEDVLGIAVNDSQVDDGGEDDFVPPF